MIDVLLCIAWFFFFFLVCWPTCTISRYPGPNQPMYRGNDIVVLADHVGLTRIRINASALYFDSGYMCVLHFLFPTLFFLDFFAPKFLLIFLYFFVFFLSFFVFFFSLFSSLFFFCSGFDFFFSTFWLVTFSWFFVHRPYDYAVECNSSHPSFSPPCGNLRFQWIVSTQGSSWVAAQTVNGSTYTTTVVAEYFDGQIVTITSDAVWIRYALHLFCLFVCFFFGCFFLGAFLGAFFFFGCFFFWLLLFFLFLFAFCWCLRYVFSVEVPVVF